MGSDSRRWCEDIYLLSKFPVTDLEHVKELVVFRNTRLRSYCTTFQTAPQVLPTAEYITLCHNRREPRVLIYLNICMAQQIGAC